MSRMTVCTYDDLREEVWEGNLDGGLPIRVLRRPGFLKRHAYLGTKYGSIDLTYSGPGGLRTDPAGIAHFLEHELFEREEGDVSQLFAAKGADSNAFTSHRMTVYMFGCIENYYDNLETLVEFVGSPVLSPEGVTKEKSIIGQEIRMYEDHPYWRLYRGILEGMYQNHPVRYDIAGTEASIADIDSETLQTVYKSFYNPSNMVLVCSGDVDPEEAWERANSAFSKSNYGDAADVVRSFPDEPKDVTAKRKSIPMPVIRPRIFLGLKSPVLPTSGKDQLEWDLVGDMAMNLLFGPSTTFYETHYDTGLIDSSFSASYDVCTQYGHAIIGGDTDHPDELAEFVLETIQGARAGEIDFAQSEAVERARKKGLGDTIRGFNSTDQTAYKLVAGHMDNYDPFDVPALIRGITPDRLRTFVEEMFHTDRSAVTIIEPAN